MAEPTNGSQIPETKYITLVSRDGFEFVVPREATKISPAITGMLDPLNNFKEAQTARCTFEEINGIVLEKVAEYFQYWYRNKDQEDVADLEIPPEICLEVLMAADFLGLT
ncbi:transcriptional elongation regulator (elongin c) [Zalerion maritima]|uniref:Elongin-C n=1 Tax=Zalerion maritima TaxID=339359 RepID=A0AAD5WNW5_9PEZI|nr:transcriptional elongation regulator (elongin c) [Zalerion maritima]